MVSLAQKILYSLILSAVVFTGIAILAFTGIFNAAVYIIPPALNIFLLSALFLTLFLTIFFCFNMRPDIGFADFRPADIKPRAIKSADEKSGDEAERITMPVKPSELPNVKIAFGDDDPSAELEELEAVSPVLLLPLLKDDNEINDEVIELEDISAGLTGGISMFSRLFAFSPGNPKLLPEAAHIVRHGVLNEILYEKNGIHYINRSAFDNDNDTGKDLNGDFAELVDSVVRKI